MTKGPKGPISERAKAKRAQILAIAAKLFLAHGYEGVSVDAVTREAGGSKTNIYTHFGGKEGLFTAAVDALCAEILEPLAAIDLAGRPLTEGLRAVGRTYLSLILEPRALALYRLVIAESARFPRLGRAWFAAGPETAYGLVARYLRTQQRAGRLRSGNPRRIAALFLDMLAFDIHQHALLRVAPRPDRKARERLVAESVATFLHGNAAG